MIKTYSSQLSMVNVAFKLSTDRELRKLIYICCLFMNPKSFNHQNKINGLAETMRIVSHKIQEKVEETSNISNYQGSMSLLWVSEL